MNRLQPAQRANNIPPNFFAILNRRLEQLRASGANIIRLDAGSPDLPPAPFIIDTLKQEAERPTVHGYGKYIGEPFMGQAIADYYKRRFDVQLEPNEVISLIGSKEGIAHLHLAWVDEGDVVLVPGICYPTYSVTPLMAGAQVVRFDMLPERGWLPDFSQIPVEQAEKARMLWINYPNNPTGAVANLEFFAEAVEFCRKYEILLCHDNPYSELTFDDYRAPSVLQIPGAKEIAVEFNSLSKTYNLAGWRLGMAVGYAPAIQTLGKLKAQVDSGAPRPVQSMGATALNGDQSWWLERNDIYQNRRDVGYEGLRRLGLQLERPKGGMYLWFKVPDGYTSRSFQETILEQAHVTLTPGDIYGPNGEGWARITLVSPAERIAEALERIERVLG